MNRLKEIHNNNNQLSSFHGFHFFPFFFFFGVAWLLTGVFLGFLDGVDSALSGLLGLRFLGVFSVPSGLISFASLRKLSNCWTWSGSGKSASIQMRVAIQRTLKNLSRTVSFSRPLSCSYMWLNMKAEILKIRNCWSQYAIKRLRNTL